MHTGNCGECRGLTLSGDFFTLPPPWDVVSHQIWGTQIWLDWIANKLQNPPISASPTLWLKGLLCLYFLPNFIFNYMYEFYVCRDHRLYWNQSYRGSRVTSCHVVLLDSNSGPLEDQQALLAAEMWLHPWNIAFYLNSGIQTLFLTCTGKRFTDEAVSAVPRGPF